MTTVILSVACPELPGLQALAAVLDAELARGGRTDVRTFELAGTKLAYCQGDFDCWIQTPGICRSKDAQQDILRAVHDADDLVLLDAVTFGGHSYELKRAQDRLIGLVVPFFETRNALTHHPARYARPAGLYSLGWLPEPDAEQQATWLALADANAINLLAPRVGAAVVDDAHRTQWPQQVAAMLASRDSPGHAIQARAPLRDALRDAARPSAALGPPAPRTAALLVGSAKPKGTSASERLARALAARLECAGVATQLHFATEFVHAGRAAQAAAQAIAACDLFVVATPLYVDALPALAVRALGLVAAVRAASPPPPARFVTLVNCGFPEPEQNRTALRIARHFAARAGYHWAGGLPLGGGGALSPEPLDEQHGPADHIRRALDLAAADLARGDDVGDDARALMMKSPMPDVVYRIAGDVGWRLLARRNGLSQRELRARPFDEPKRSG